MGLFKPGWQSTNADRALRAVEKMKDDPQLLKAAREAPLPAVRIRAAARIEAPETLLELALHGRPESVGEAAAKKLSDGKMLLEVALHSEASGARTLAVDRLNDQAALTRIAFECDRPYTRERAVRRLTDQTTLKKIALTGESYAVRLAAVERLNDPAALEKIALTDNSETVRLGAVKRVRDENALARIALGSSEKVSGEAASRLTSPGALERVAAGTADWRLAGKLVDRLKDEEALMRLVLNAREENTRHHAAFRIKSPEKAKALLIKCESRYAAGPLWGKLASAADLVDVVRQAESGAIRQMAIKNLEAADPEALETLAAEGFREARDLLVRRRGGFTCSGCGRAFYPAEGETLPCICPDCGAENHDFHYRSDIREYRDYEVGTSWEECSRCGKRINCRTVNTM